MTTPNLALYRLLVKFGAAEADAEAAAQGFTPEELAALATKADIAQLTLATKAQFAEFEARLAWKIGGLIVGAMVSMTGIFAVIVGWLVR